MKTKPGPQTRVKCTVPGIESVLSPEFELSVLSPEFHGIPGEWRPGFNAQNEMLDDFSKKYRLEEQGWRKNKSWYKAEE